MDILVIKINIQRPTLMVVEPYAVVGDNPAEVIKYQFSGDEIEKLLKLKWWN